MRVWSERVSSQLLPPLHPLLLCFQYSSLPLSSFDPISFERRFWLPERSLGPSMANGLKKRPQDSGHTLRARAACLAS